MTTAQQNTQGISYTPEGAVSISYQTLVSSPLSLGTSIGKVFSIDSFATGFIIMNDTLPEQAFGSSPDSLGIIIVRDLPPPYVAYRERLLKLAYKYANLDEHVREKYTDPGSRYR